jgi:hypothetical protein
MEIFILAGALILSMMTVDGMPSKSKSGIRDDAEDKS